MAVSNAMIKKALIAFFIALLFMLLPMQSYAHSGRTDANVGHYNHATGEYHYHNGSSSNGSSSSSSKIDLSWREIITIVLCVGFIIFILVSLFR